MERVSEHHRNGRYYPLVPLDLANEPSISVYDRWQKAKVPLSVVVLTILGACTARRTLRAGQAFVAACPSTSNPVQIMYRHGSRYLLVETYPVPQSADSQLRYLLMEARSPSRYSLKSCYRYVQFESRLPAKHAAILPQS